MDGLTSVPRDTAAMYRHKPLKDAASSRASQDKRNRAKERFTMKMQARNPLYRAPGVGIMLPGKVRKHKKSDNHYNMPELYDTKLRMEVLLQTSSAPGPLRRDVQPVVKPVKSTSASPLLGFRHGPEKTPEPLQSFPDPATSTEKRKRSNQLSMQSLIDKIVLRRQVMDRYLDDRYRLYRGEQSELEKTPMVIRSYEPPKAPFAIHQSERRRKLVFITPQKVKYRSGPHSSIVVIDNRRQPPIMEQEEDALLQHPHGWKNRTEELDIKTWRPEMRSPHKQSLHPNAEDRYIRNYKLERQLGMKMEMQGEYNEVHFSSQARVLPPIRVPCQPVYLDEETADRRKTTTAKFTDSAELVQSENQGEGRAATLKKQPIISDSQDNPASHCLCDQLVHEYETNLTNSPDSVALVNQLPSDDGAMQKNDHHVHDQGNQPLNNKDKHFHLKDNHPSHGQSNQSLHEDQNLREHSDSTGCDSQHTEKDDIKLEVKGEEITRSRLSNKSDGKKGKKPSDGNPDDSSQATGKTSEVMMFSVHMPAMTLESKLLPTVPMNTPDASDAGSDCDDNDNDSVYHNGASKDVDDPNSQIIINSVSDEAEQTEHRDTDTVDPSVIGENAEDTEKSETGKGNAVEQSENTDMHNEAVGEASPTDTVVQAEDRDIQTTDLGGGTNSISNGAESTDSADSQNAEAA